MNAIEQTYDMCRTEDPTKASEIAELVSTIARLEKSIQVMQEQLQDTQNMNKELTTAYNDMAKEMKEMLHQGYPGQESVASMQTLGKRLIRVPLGIQDDLNRRFQAMKSTCAELKKELYTVCHDSVKKTLELGKQAGLTVLDFTGIREGIGWLRKVLAAGINRNMNDLSYHEKNLKSYKEQAGVLKAEMHKIASVPVSFGEAKFIPDEKFKDLDKLIDKEETRIEKAKGRLSMLETCFNRLSKTWDILQAFHQQRSQKLMKEEITYDPEITATFQAPVNIKASDKQESMQEDYSLRE